MAVIKFSLHFKHWYFALFSKSVVSWNRSVRHDTSPWQQRNKSLFLLSHSISSAIIPFTYTSPQFCISLKKFTPYRISIKAEEIVWLWWKIEHGAASHIQAPNFSNSPLFSHKKSELSATMLPIQVSWHSKRQILSSWTFPTCQRHFIICRKKAILTKSYPITFRKRHFKVKQTHMCWMTGWIFSGELRLVFLKTKL